MEVLGKKMTASDWSVIMPLVRARVRAIIITLSDTNRCTTTLNRPYINRDMNNSLSACRLV